MRNSNADTPITVISNRLPLSPRREEGGQWSLTGSNGGLVSALDPVLRKRGGRWLGWSGHTGRLPAQLKEQFAAASKERGYELVPVSLSADDVRGFYNGFSNRALWPLLHNLLGHCAFEPDDWRSYETVNRHFAETVVGHGDGEEELIWVHDYHLMLLARELKALGHPATLAFFLHIPFPPPDTFMVLPWRAELLKALLAFDLVGFQTNQDRDNFLACIATLSGTEPARKDGDNGVVRIEPRSSRPTRYNREPLLAGSSTLVGGFPISIDVEQLAHRAETHKVLDFAEHLKRGVHHQTMIFGADRLDYTKGLLQRMKAYRRLLREYPELHGRITYVQYVVPGRETIPEYDQMHQEIERLVGEIDGQYTQPGWVPLHYIYRKLDMDQLLAYYRAADVALVTPVRDGMNLIAKEFCAARTDNDGVLVLSEFAGAARELYEDAVMVNPYNEEAMAAQLYRACTMPAEERRKRMSRLRRRVSDWDIHHWVDAFLNSAAQSGYTGRPPADLPTRGSTRTVA